MGVRRRYLVGAAVVSISASATANAQTEPHYKFDVPPQELKFALRTVTREAGLQLFAAADALRGLQSPALHADTTAADALQQLLAGTDLQAEVRGKVVFIRGRVQAGDQSNSRSPAATDIVVTGSRIEKGAVASPIITLTQKLIRQSGQNDLGDALRSLPQSFSGGQNPGVAPGAVGVDNQDITAGSSPNLRGLGADATLTLLNGHRLSYGSYIQAVDISAIPLAAVQRVDIVPDGASAIYGSDAVGGVVNVILKPDYNGLTTSSRIGGATGGGDFEQQYDATGGFAWKSGGFIATYDYTRATAIHSDQRSFTAYMPDGNTLMAARRGNSAVLSGHQALGPDVTFSIDATYNHRWSSSTIDEGGGFAYVNSPVDVAISVAPSLKLALGSDWSISLSGLYANDHAHFDQTSFSGSPDGYRSRGCYCDTANAIELSSGGRLFPLPGGDARIALGGGYRRNSYHEYSTVSATYPVIHGSLESYYAFGELFMPLVTPAQEITWIRQLSVDAALRYERYPGMAQVATPKLGLVYAPSGDLDVKLSWGKSFKAPTLLQTYEQAYAFLYPIDLLGGSRFPAGSQALLAYGGNPDLKPERATNWTSSLIVHPVSVPGLRLEASYFHIDYRNRIIEPLSGAALFNALSDPSYHDYVAYAPSEAAQSAVINAAAQGLSNYAGTPYNPSAVAALVSDLYINAARQRIRGIDLSATYHADLGRAGALDLRALASWLHSRQTLRTTAPSEALSGTIFNPPHYKGLAAATWTWHSASLTATVNYIGGLTDTTQAPHVRVGSQTTLDLVATLDVGRDHGLLGNLGFSLAVRNALNQRPPYAAPSGGLPYYVDYDSTNYSAIGRFVGLTVSKTW